MTSMYAIPDSLSPFSDCRQPIPSVSYHSHRPSNRSSHLNKTPSCNNHA